MKRETNSDMIPDIIAWISAEADRPRTENGEGAFLQKLESQENGLQKNARPEDVLSEPFSIRDLPVHQFPAPSAAPVQAVQPEASTENAEIPQSQSVVDESGQLSTDEDEFGDVDRERRIYRNRTVAMLRRYMRYSIETGRLPSLLGREFFRTQITSYQVSTFEDRVIFVHDMDRCLDRLDNFAREVLARVVLQEYEHDEAARLIGCTRMTVHRKLMEALDTLSDILVAVGLLDAVVSNREKSCQGGKSTDFSSSDSEQGK